MWMVTSPTDLAIQETIITFQFFSECQNVTTGNSVFLLESLLRSHFFIKTIWLVVNHCKLLLLGQTVPLVFFFFSPNWNCSGEQFGEPVWINKWLNPNLQRFKVGVKAYLLLAWITSNSEGNICQSDKGRLQCALKSDRNVFFQVHTH